MDIAAKLDDIGKPAWLGVMVLGFILFWPVGLGILIFLIWSGRMGGWKRDGFEDMSKSRGRWYVPMGSGWGRSRSQSTGNHAFDEYRTETLRRLEEEEREFRDFLDKLRQAKDKAEFDQFMADRQRRGGPEAQPQG
jgi:hypothetical protein